MTFTRTTSGLSNQHIFHGVDCVVFVEGGADTLSFQDVCGGQAGSTSFDILYWQVVFRIYSPGKKYCFKPVGSKGTLRQIADEISKGNVSHVYVAMDQDFDRFHKRTIEADGVFYTWGYSWENDLFHEAILEESVFAVCPIDRTTNEEAVNADITRVINNIVDDIRWFVHADIVMSQVNGGVFDRRNWKQYARATGGLNGEPFFDPRDLRLKVKSTNRSKARRSYRGVSERICIRRDCFGHILGVFLCRIFFWLANKYSGTASMASANVNALLIQSFRNIVDRPAFAEIRKHHELQFAFIDA